MTEHTSGPWAVKLPRNGAIHITAPTAGPGDVCDLYHTYRDESGEHIFIKDNAAANARLIAAAPELLEALSWMLADPNDSVNIQRASTAINKAKGVDK